MATWQSTNQSINIWQHGNNQSINQYMATQQQSIREILIGWKKLLNLRIRWQWQSVYGNMAINQSTNQTIKNGNWSINISDCCNCLLENQNRQRGNMAIKQAIKLQAMIIAVPLWDSVLFAVHLILSYIQFLVCLVWPVGWFWGVGMLVDLGLEAACWDSG